MNLNHDPDKHLLDQIDKLIEIKQSSGSALLDELATTRPIPRPTAQTALEERLLAQMETMNQGETTMATSTNTYLPIIAPRRNWLPLTLLAALIVVAIAGLMLINGIGKAPKINEVALVQVTTTATLLTSSPTSTEISSSTISLTSPATYNTSVVQIRLSALTRDSLLPGVGGAVDVVALLPFKADSNIGDIPSTPMPDGSRLVETYVLRNTFVFYQSNQSQTDGVIAISVSANDSRLLSWLAEQPNVMFRLQKPLNNVFDIPDNNTIVSIPFDNVTASENIQPGDRVNVISTCAFVPDVMGANNTLVSSKTDCNQPVEETRAINAQVFIGEIVVEGRQPVTSYDSISLVIPKDSVTLFSKLNDAKMHFKLVPSTKAVQPTATQTLIASPTISLSSTSSQIATQPPDFFSRIINIRRDHLLTNGEDVMRGDSVNILAVCAFIPETKDTNNTIIPAKTDCSQKTETQIVNAGVVLMPYVVTSPSGSDVTLSIAVYSDEEAQILPMIDSGMVFKLVKTTSASPYFTINIPLGIINSVSDPLHVNDAVDIYTTCIEVATPSPSSLTPSELTSSKVDCTKAVEQQETTGRIVVMNDTSVSISVPSAVQSRLYNMIMGGMRFKLVKSLIRGLPTPIPSPTIVSTPTPVPQSTNSTPTNLKPVVVTQQDIPLGTKIDADVIAHLSVEYLPVNTTESEIYTDISQLKGMFASKDIRAGQPIHTDDVSFQSVLPLPSGKVAIDIPVASLLFVSITLNGPDYQEGNYVDGYAVFKAADINSTAPAVFNQPLTTQSDQSNNQITQRVVRAALILKSKSEDVLTLAVSPDEAKVIQWLLDTHLSLKVRPIPAIDVPTSIVLPPHYSISLNLDSVSHWSADDLQVGDKVDVVVGLVIGNGSNLKLEFKPYGEYNWVGSPFNGKNSAQTYIPLNPNSQSGAIFLRRVLQNVTVTAVTSRIDPDSGQAQTVALTIEVQSEAASTDGSFLKQWGDVGMSYLIIKH